MPPETQRFASATRRGFLQLAGATAAFTALAQLRAVPAGAAAATDSSAARFFPADATEILTQIVERMVDSGEVAAPRVRATRAIETIDALCAALDPDVTAPLESALWLFEYGPIVFDLRFSRFTRLGPEEQDASLRGWMTSRFQLRRQAFYALRNLAFLGYYAQDAVWPSIGYAGPLLGREEAAG
ncbi:MAG: hypothetical protein JSU66_04690 [Deltaproteobacteria bacterium]|nr:MAG: hypothetical protein JSU66_04690 [Deltaproteobacteria bacterium]